MNPKLKTTTALPELENIGQQFAPHEEVIAQGDLFQLVSETDPILKAPTVKWDFTQPEEIAQRMYLSLSRTMRESDGMGLSANQVGLPYSVFVLESGYGFPMGFFNPVIVDTSEEEVTLEEGCLSFPELVVKIKRPAKVRIRFAEWNGEVHTKTFEGMTARAIQHEMDHFQGITFKERANKIHLEKALRQRTKHRKLLKQHAI